MTSPHARSHRRLPQQQERRLAHGLGWFSIGLGLAQVFAPRAMSRFIGAPANPALTRALGVREIISGIGVLTVRNPAPWLWARTAGDMMDAALLGAAFHQRRAHAGRLAAATAAVAAVTALDLHAAERLTPGVGGTGLLHVRDSVIIGSTPDALYEFWRNVENLPRVMPHLKSVTLTGGNRSHWVAHAPGGIDVEWDSEIIVNRPGEEIAWQSVDGSDIYNAGSVHFEPVPGGGTRVAVHMAYRPPAGPLGVAIASLLGREPHHEIEADLEAFKQAMESEGATQQAASTGASIRNPG